MRYAYIYIYKRSRARARIYVYIIIIYTPPDLGPPLPLAVKPVPFLYV